MTGKVYLVGAGPGDPGLLTLRGLECLSRADLVLYDGLVNPLLLRHTTARAERTCRAESPGGRRLQQQEINERLIAAAREGKTVVRLKGGDPFVFGRGGEEAAALAAAGIPFEVIPGVTAAVAASAYAGISLTHRECASAVAFVTGHEDPRKEETALDYGALASFPGTLVFYMGLHRLAAIAAALLAAGKAATTPVAVVSRGTTPGQRTVTGTLPEIAALVARAELHAPSIIIIGECIRLRETIAWFEQRPLFGQHIGIARPIEQAGPQIARLTELGAQPVLMPTIRIEPPEDWSAVDDVLGRIGDFDWIVFTSANGVGSLLGRLREIGGDARRLGSAKIAAIGEGTAAALAQHHLRADLIPPSFRAESLAESLQPLVSGRRVLWARASRGRDVLPNELKRAGAVLEELVVYRNLDVDRLDADAVRALEQGEVDWICLSSPSIARALERMLTPVVRAQLTNRTRVASISPVTSAAARDAGLPVHAEADIHTWEGIFEAIGRQRK
jgi:uroporphyrinogen III methyltransferase / synthase